MQIYSEEMNTRPMDRAAILDILVDWNYWGEFHHELQPRPGYQARALELFSARTALMILGIRRAGKSSLVNLCIQDLIDTGVISATDSLIINFEDPRFSPVITGEDLMGIFETYLTTIDPDDPIVVLDEVQNVTDWERFTRYLLEAKQVRVIVTGSSSKLLDREISEVLTGRHVNLEVMPLSFREVLEFRGVSIGSSLDVQKQRIEIRRQLIEYCTWGGFPEVVLSTSTARKQELLLRYFDDILMKDIVKRFTITKIMALEMLADLYVAHIGTLQSFNKLKVKVGTSLDTVERYSSYLELARLFIFIDKFDWSKGKQIRSVKKVYLSDIGPYLLKGFRFSENYGRIAENIIAIELMRRKRFDPRLEIYYWRDYQGHEVDFVLKIGSRITSLIQVHAITSSEDLKPRELAALVKAQQATNCAELLVITDGYEGEVEHDGATVTLIPLAKWLLNIDGNG